MNKCCLGIKAEVFKEASCWSDAVSAETQGGFPTGFNSTYCAVLKAFENPTHLLWTGLLTKTRVCCLWGEKASLVGQKTFGVLLLSLCSIFLALLGCKHSHPVPANPFRSAVIWRGFLSVCEALENCSSGSSPFEIKRGICVVASLKFLCNSLDFALN